MWGLIWWWDPLDVNRGGVGVDIAEYGMVIILYHIFFQYSQSLPKRHNLKSNKHQSHREPIVYVDNDDFKPAPLISRTTKCQLYNEPTSDPTETSENNRRRYKFNNISNDFMATPVSSSACDALIQRIDVMEHSQSEINQLDSDLCSRVFEEMDNYIKYNDQTKITRKKCPKLSANRSRLLDRFKEKRDIFDKALGNAERNYNRKFADEIEEINTSDPNIFWDYIRKLGPRQSRDIPTKVYGDDNTLCDDPEIVLHKWKSEFEALYNIPDSQNDKFDDTFFGW